MTKEFPKGMSTHTGMLLTYSVPASSTVVVEVPCKDAWVPLHTFTESGATILNIFGAPFRITTTGTAQYDTFF